MWKFVKKWSGTYLDTFWNIKNTFHQKSIFPSYVAPQNPFFLILESFDHLKLVGWWNVFLVVQNDFRVFENQNLTIFCWNWDIKRVIEDRILKFAKMQQAWTFYRYFSVEITFGLVVIDFVWTWGQKQILLTKFCQSVPVDAWTEKFL